MNTDARVVQESEAAAGQASGPDRRRTSAVLAARAIPIGRGRTIVVRPVRPWDEDGLSDLYDQLDLGDRYLRFFGAYRPSVEFIQTLANPGPREARVVAELAEHGGRHLVAEAGYSVLANGNGEFAMVVAKEWRGWLGPYLLDVVIELAAQNGVPNLEAEILATNYRMLAIMRARGCVLLGHDGWNELRTMVGTGPHGPTWAGADDRPRVLVETPGGRWPLEDAADAAGLRVFTCGGPTQNGSCPMLSGHECELAARADAIVVRNAQDDPRWECVLRGHSSSHPDIPVIVEGASDDPHTTTIDEVTIPAFIHFYLSTSRRSTPDTEHNTIALPVE
jgi:hypothetical protein